MRPRWNRLLAGAGIAAGAWIVGTGDAAPPRSVVAYLVSASSGAVIENEAFADRRRPAHPWQWRAFDPATGRDTLVMTLPSFPTRVRWDPDYRFVEYAIGGRVERAPWRMGARPLERVRLPLDSALCDFWSDRAGRWHAVTQEDHVSDDRGPIRILTRWNRATDGTWRVAAVDTAEEGFGSCLDARYAAGPERGAAVHLGDLLDGMRVGAYPATVLREVPDGGTENEGAWVWIPSAHDTATGLEVKVETGDTDHAMEPVVWVDRRRGRRSIVCPVGGTHDEAAGQVAFAQRDGFLLVAAEYSGAYPIVADLRTGKVVFTVSRPSARAVWVPAPR